MITRLPAWFRQEIPRDINLIKNRLKSFENHNLNTVCLSARCPNISRCFEDNSVTFMILGDACSRNCRFCAVNKERPRALGLSEAYNLALTIRSLN
ncbi:lipoyl synthase, partial [bacterium]